jgi:hypothetical protein
MNNSRFYIWTLYRNLIKLGKKFPSRNRHNIVQAIREDFRDHKCVTDANKLKRYISEAENGLKMLEKYNGMKESKSELYLNLS